MLKRYNLIYLGVTWNLSLNLGKRVDQLRLNVYSSNLVMLDDLQEKSEWSAEARLSF